jgi:decaprenylphospho-beta-D-erythro-pentofuranosid-2-ulose 2-reductase
MPQTAVVIGGSSDIARATMRLLAQRRLHRAVLAGPHPDALEEAAEELRALGVAEVTTVPLDASEPSAPGWFNDRVVHLLGRVDLVLVATGYLGTAALGELTPEEVVKNLTVNFTGPAALTLALAKTMVAQGSGRIVVLSSVAGVRTRRANFVYGSAKAGLDGFALGLSDVLVGTGVDVTVVRPGFVRTKMTTGLPDAPLTVGPQVVAAALVRALETGQAVVWVPPVLRAVFGGLRLLPRSVWRRLPG